MSDEAAFLRAICAQPDEDTPRLVFADWLDEQGGEGDAHWAELIRDQVCPGGERWTAYYLHNKYWLRAWAAARFGFPETLEFDGWKRGFPIRLVAPVGALLAEWDRVLCSVPVTEVRAEGAADADVEALVAHCDLRNLRELFVRSDVRANGSALTDRALVALAECPALSELKCLYVEWVGLTDRGADALIRSPYLANLREFHIGRAQNFAATFEAVERIRARFGAKAIS